MVRTQIEDVKVQRASWRGGNELRQDTHAWSLREITSQISRWQKAEQTLSTEGAAYAKAWKNTGTCNLFEGHQGVRQGWLDIWVSSEHCGQQERWLEKLSHGRLWEVLFVCDFIVQAMDEEPPEL